MLRFVSDSYPTEFVKAPLCTFGREVFFYIFFYIFVFISPCLLQ